MRTVHLRGPALLLLLIVVSTSIVSLLFYWSISSSDERSSDHRLPAPIERAIANRELQRRNREWQLRGENSALANTNANTEDLDAAIARIQLRIWKMERAATLAWRQRTKIKPVALAELVQQKEKEEVEWSGPYAQFVQQISNEHVYTLKESDVLEKLLNAMNESPILEVEPKSSSRGTQLKFFAQLIDGSEVVIKPMRNPREYERPRDLWYFHHKESHVGEIAAFHLDRVLGFWRVPPCVGRVLKVSRDVQPFADPATNRSIYRSPIGNLCFHSKCTYYCDAPNAVCGNPDDFEASMCTMLPYSIFTRANILSPWRRSYSRHWREEWEKHLDEPAYCARALNKSHLLRGRHLLDFVDIHIVDYLMGNQDRHHFEYIEELGLDSNLVLLDNGKGFQTGGVDTDDPTILAPLTQCCVVYNATYEKLKLLAHNADGVRLSHLMSASLANDPLQLHSAYGPLLNARILETLDRRLRAVVKAIDDCIARAGDDKLVTVDSWEQIQSKLMRHEFAKHDKPKS